MKILRLAVGAFLVFGLGAFYYRDSFFEKREFSVTTAQTRGVTFYDRLRTDDSKYLVLDLMGLKPKGCIILDYDGNVVFEFPSGSCRFSASGTFYHAPNYIMAFDVDGTKKWETKNYRQHHSIDFAESSQELFLIGQEMVGKDIGRDTVVGVNTEGKEIFYWGSQDHFNEIAKIIGHFPKNSFPDQTLPVHEITHFNSVQVIPENKSANQIPAFRPGNLLVNCFLQSVMFIIDRQTKKIVWSKILNEHENRGAHRTKVLPNGHIFYFLNKWNADDGTERNFSKVIEYDPVSDKVVWQYDGGTSNRFLSSRWSATEVVGEDQFLVTVAEQGVVAQLNRRGRILWEWHSGFENNEILPAYEMDLVDKSLVDRHIKQWKSMGNVFSD